VLTNRKWRRKGAVLPYIIIIYFICTVIAGVIYGYTNTIIKQTIRQQRNILAYYCTLTGLNMASGSLLMDNHSLFDEFSDPDVSKSLSDYIQVPLAPDKPFDPKKSNAYIEISNNAAKPDMSTGVIDAADNGWVHVKVTGTYVDGGGKATTNVGSVYYRMNNPFVFEQQFDAIY